MSWLVHLATVKIVVEGDEIYQVINPVYKIRK